MSYRNQSPVSVDGGGGCPVALSFPRWRWTHTALLERRRVDLRSEGGMTRQSDRPTDRGREGVRMQCGEESRSETSNRIERRRRRRSTWDSAVFVYFKGLQNLAGGIISRSSINQCNIEQYPHKIIILVSTTCLM